MTILTKRQLRAALESELGRVKAAEEEVRQRRDGLEQAEVAWREMRKRAEWLSSLICTTPAIDGDD